MEKSDGKKMGQESVAARLRRMGSVMNEALHTDVQRDGTVVVLEKPTILRTPPATATGELAFPAREVERVELPAQRRVSLSDLGDHSMSALGRAEVGGSSAPPAPKKKSAAVRRDKSPIEGQTEQVLGSPQEQEVIGIESASTEHRTRPEGAVRGSASCARTSPYTSPSGATTSAKQAKKDKKAEKTRLKRAREEKRAGKAHKKPKSTTEAQPGTSTVRAKPRIPEEGRRTENTTIELPLYTAQAVEGGYMKFATMTLSDGLQGNNNNRLTQAAVLVMHAAHSLFCAAKDEAQMLANKKKYQVLVRAHEARVKEVEEKVAKMDEVQAELMDKANQYESVKAALDEQTTELEMEVALKHLAVGQCEDAKRELAEVQAKAAAEHEGDQANIVALSKELEEARARVANMEGEMEEVRARAAKMEGEMEEAKLKVVEEFKASATLKDMELKWKQEAYYQGVDTNFQLLSYYGALDFPKFMAASADPVAEAGAPKETYAEQWGHLLPAINEEGGAEDEANA